MKTWLALAILAGGIPHSAFAIDPPCDATTGASMRVMGISTTTSGSTIAWREGHTNGERWFCYGKDTATNCAKAQSRAGGVKNQVTSGLIANTTYKYRWYGVWGGSKKSIVTGTFITNAGACVMPQVSEIKGRTVTEAKVPLEMVQVTVTNKNTNKVVGIDTTDDVGRYSIVVSDEANYLIAFSYPPFTAPGSITQWVQIQIPKVLADQVFKGAFQIGGTVVGGVAGKDSLLGAAITVKRKSDGAIECTRTTNDNGHFAFGIKPGDYLVDVRFQGVTRSQIPLTVTKDATMPDIKLEVIPTSVRKGMERKGFRLKAGGSIPYRVNGARVKAR